MSELGREPDAAGKNAANPKSPMGARWPLLRTQGLWALVILVIAAIALRVGLGLVWPSIHWPDEIFQTLEPAHRAAFGYGIKPWEFRDGARSWLLPGMLAGVMKVSEPLGPGAWGYFGAVTILLSALSTTPVVVTWAWMRRLKMPHALWAAAAVACWCDLVHFGPKAFSEVVAAHLLIAGLYLARFHDERPRRLVVAGVLLGLAVALRIHLGPAIALAAWLCVRPELGKRGLPLLAAAGGVLLSVGLLDAVTWSYPFQSYWVTFRFNVLQGGGARWGTFPPLHYIGWYGNVWSVGLIVMLVLAYLSTRRDWALVGTAIAVLVTHAALSHKEYRFAYPATVLLIVAGAIELFSRLAWEGLPKRWMRHGLACAGMVAWLGLSGLAAWRLTPQRTDNGMGRRELTSLFRWHAGQRQLALALSKRPSPCGLGLVGIPWFLSGGYAHLHHRVPMFLCEKQAQFEALSEGFNAVLAPRELELGDEWTKGECSGDVCLWSRPGTCRVFPGYDVNRVLEKRGE